MRTAFTKAITGLLAAASATILAVTLGAAPAHAETNLRLKTKAWGGYVANAGQVYFNATSEIFTLYDNASDGAGVSVSWSYEDNNGNFYYPPDLYLGTGAGTQQDFNKSITDGFEVTIMVCVIDNGSVKANTCTVGTAVA
ncbi:hypothetical protein B0I29_117131 [Actinoplanes lutulentus]|uniref:PKD domain-containing protein n=1 Tax=Actinoplanes lutulentus TaxID=1287878 RepID=A0A327Z4U0_9ACTN|nr:hypothetical protein [Actinoplanes lutulentus]RAK29805.1 hypothetical protein B0I29_117131 [Actinoplanes lutulentus]